MVKGKSSSQLDTQASLSYYYYYYYFCSEATCSFYHTLFLICSLLSLNAPEFMGMQQN